MKTEFTFKHFDSSEALVTYTQEKLEKLEKYEFKPVHAHWVFSIQRHECKAEVTIVGPLTQIKATATTRDFYDSVDSALGKLEKQLKKIKDKVKNHHHRQERMAQARLRKVS